MARALVLVALLVGLGACAGGGEAATDEVDRDAFGYRLPSDNQRETMTLQPVADSSRALVYPAVVSSVTVRKAGRPLPGDAVAVEVVIDGALPDACAELSGISQSRAGHYVDVELTMRQPLETVCAAVVRPFRYYLVLDTGFEAGSYVLRVNGSATPFQVLPALGQEASPDAG